MIMTTTSTLHGHEVSEYMGIVVGEAIMGANVFKDIISSISDIVGGRSGAYEAEMGKARQVAFDEMEAEAHRLGADGIIGVDIDYEVIGKTGSMLMVSVSGTAVRLA